MNIFTQPQGVPNGRDRVFRLRMIEHPAAMYVAEGVLFVAQIYQQVLQLEILKLRQLERPLIQLLLLGRAKAVKQ